MAYFTVTPSFFSVSPISRSACCACATAIPYPGTMMTEPAFFMMKAASSAEPCLTVRSPKSAPGPALSPPKPPRITEMNDRFIPLHMM